MAVLVIAETGVNHNGDLKLARRLIEAAAGAGADVVKFQTFSPDRLVSKTAAQAEYQQKNAPNETQYQMLKALALPSDAFAQLAANCSACHIGFASSPFDREDIDILAGLDMPFWKIPSGEITNLPYLLKIAQTGKPVILSTGMSELEEIKIAVNILRENGAGEITVLHCNTEYPTPFEDVNLRAMETLRKELDVPVGYSDHTPGIEAAIAAVAMGAIVIEKHFTMDKTMEGPDHKASLEPDELAAMVRAIRHIEKAMGSGVKAPSSSELKNRPVARKSIVAKHAIQKGELLTEENIAVKRPGTGISPMRWFEILGTTAVRNFAEDEMIEE